jgi:hypothetical protein
MSRNKKYLPATGPKNITTQPAARPGAAAPAGGPDVSAASPFGGMSLVGAGALVLLVALVGGLLLIRDEGAPVKSGPPAPDGPKADLKGKRWDEVLEDLAARGQLGNKKWEPEPWVPSSEADKLIDRFVALKKVGDPGADALLGGKALTEEQVIDEADVERLSTDTYLRQPLKALAIHRGEPDGRGGQKAAANRYTLACQGPIQTPPFRVRDARGEALLTRDLITGPGELVVEVRGGKIHGVRSTTGR